MSKPLPGALDGASDPRAALLLVARRHLDAHFSSYYAGIVDRLRGEGTVEWLPGPLLVEAGLLEADTPDGLVLLDGRSGFFTLLADGTVERHPTPDFRRHRSTSADSVS